MRLGGEVDHRVAPRSIASATAAGSSIAPWTNSCSTSCEVLAPARVGELVEHDDLVAVVAHAHAHEVRADEAGSAADQQPHRATTAFSLEIGRAGPSCHGGSTGARRARCRARCTPGAARAAGSASVVVGSDAAAQAGAVEDLDGELVPRARAAARRVEDADVAVALGELDERRGEVHRPRRAADLVARRRSPRRARAPRREHRVDEVRARRRRRATRCARSRARRSPRRPLLAGELRAPVGADRVDGVGLDPRLALGRRRTRSRSRRARRARRPRAAARATLPGAVAVDRRRRGLVGLGAVDVGPRRAVDDRAGLGRGQDPRDVVGVGDVELGVRERDHIVAEPGGVAATARPSIPPLPRTSNRIGSYGSAN